MTAVPDLYRTASRSSLADLGRAARPIEGSDDDYDELLELVGDRRVVLIGEASHG
jgi:erythromycin esterase-like protein